MPDWGTYQPSDFLMFSPRVYYRLIELHNEAVWPLPLFTIALGLAGIFLIVRRPNLASRAIPFILATIWLWVGWSFVWSRYATINWPMEYAAPFFAAEALLLFAIALTRRGLAISDANSLSGAALVALLLLSIVAYPLIAPVMGRDWLSAENFGITPDPTALSTLAILALARGWMRAAAMIIPLLWCTVTGLTLWTMESGDFLIPPLSAFTAILLATARQLTQTAEIPKESTIR